MDSFILYTSYYDIVGDLTDEQLGRLTRAIFAYAQDGTEIELPPVVRMAFSFIKKDMDHNDGKYQARLKARSDAGRKGGAPKGNSNARKKACVEVEETKEVGEVGKGETCEEVAEGLPEVEETDETTKNKQNNQKQAKQPKTTKNNQKQAKTSKTSLYEYEECISISSNNLESSKEASLSKDKSFDPPTHTHAEADGKDPPKGGKTEYSDIKDYWNRMAEETHSAMRRVTIMSDQRRSNVRARIRDYKGDTSVIYRAIDNAMRSDFMNGDNRNGWTASFDWIMCPANFPKVLEGNYRNEETGGEPRPSTRANAKTKTLKAINHDKLETRRGAPAPRLTDEEYKRQCSWDACE